ncbi:transcription elongation factor GreB [Entomobacter blattae]|uniref:Transcription elongation factor GreB n=1 Tax=Entomobacter blattae TaxID=2762277 RepID=A0A7H1NRS7_9PROT|nr:transcription elongation factor GreB [Entomobacter blattae]QNT78487.1 Transcription elongation factor GreB [Entomobacter blattae]
MTPMISVRRYISPQGIKTLREELNTLLQQERPRIVEIVSWAAGNGDRSENGDYQYGKKRLREIDHRVHFLLHRIEEAIVVDPSQQVQRDRVFFGARVTYITQDDVEHTVCILGMDEADVARGEISVASPVARALLGKRKGDEVLVNTPQGQDEIEILAIAYPVSVEL